MERVFESRFRTAFDRLCSGAWSDVDVVVIPRTSEQEHKLYLYLREASRLGYARALPRLYLYNLLHARSPEAYDFGLEQTRRMTQDFDCTEERLRESISESNRARTAVRSILELRRQGRLAGSEAVAMIGEFFSGDRSEFAGRMEQRLTTLASAAPMDRPRILIKGAPLDDASLHRLVEQQGGYVAAEDDWHGSRAAGEFNIRADGDPIVAIFEKYYYDAVSPRVQPSEEADVWFMREIGRGRLDGVLFYVPFTDDVAGWDYPRHLAFVQLRGIPSLLVRANGAPEAGSELTSRISAFVQCLRRA